MPPTCRRLSLLPMLLCLVLLSVSTVSAFSLESGIHGMTWGGRADDYPRLQKVREDGHASYYVDRQMTYRAGGRPVAGVVYGFYRDRFFAAYIKLRSPNQSYYLEKHFRGEYGPAKVTTAGSGDRTIYRWQDGDLKIKLKVYEADEDLKLGIYYAPLATELNRAVAEDGPGDVFGPEPSGDQGVESAPLF